MIVRSFFKENRVTIGIDDFGNFVLQLATGFSPISKNNSAYLIRLLEIDYDEFESEIEDMIAEFNAAHGNIKLKIDSFPFLQIVKSALTSERDHWVELSLPWLKKIGKKFFLEEIENILREKKNGQRIRHLLLKI